MLIRTTQHQVLNTNHLAEINEYGSSIQFRSPFNPMMPMQPSVDVWLGTDCDEVYALLLDALKRNDHFFDLRESEKAVREHKNAKWQERRIVADAIVADAAAPVEGSKA